MLNDNYQGEDVSFSYCYDLISQQHLQKNANLILTRECFIRPTDNATIQYEVRKKVARICAIGEERQVEVTQEEMIMEVMNKVFKDLPEGAPITEELLSRFIQEISEKFAPFIYHLHNRNGYRNGANEL